jgi:hypothetical protein
VVRISTKLVCGLSAVPAASLLKNLESIFSLIAHKIPCDMTSATGTRFKLDVDELAQSLFLVFGQSELNFPEIPMEEVRPRNCLI